MSLRTCLLLLPVLAAAGWASDLQRDQPNSIQHRRWKAFRAGRAAKAKTVRNAAGSGAARVLTILVEFAGTDTFEFIPSGPNASTWDPIGKMDSGEWAGKAGDCSAIVKKYDIAAPTEYTYRGPLHNRIERPRSAQDASGWRVWREDFSASYYRDLIFGDGVRYAYRRQDGSTVDRDLPGSSVRVYYSDMSGGMLGIEGAVLGWVKVPHSVMWYGADPCPGRLSSPHQEAAHNGGIAAAGSARTLVKDALEAAKQAYPDFDWASYDGDGDGLLDHLWVVTAGVAESDSGMAARTDYGEGGLWPHSASLTPAYEVAPGVSAGPYIMMAENSGAAVFVHEFGHNLGAIDLYSYGGGKASPGFWTVMCDSWVGDPTDSQPSALDPWHLDFWGWLNPLVIDDPTREYVVKLGQTSLFPGGEEVYRGVKIELEEGRDNLAVSPLGANHWWGGQQNLSNAAMTLAAPLALPPAGTPALEFSLAYDIEEQWDFLWVQVSGDGGETWTTLTNPHTTCAHDRGWVGGDSGFPEDLCAAGAGGFTGRSAEWPAYGVEKFDLSPFAGREILVRFWYMTDWASLGQGVFVDGVRITAGGQDLLSDDGEAGDQNWTYEEGWQRNDGAQHYRHAYYLQWRNTGSGGGADAGLSSPGWRYSPVPTGLLVWYNNDFYADNEIQQHLYDPPSFGPKGKLLLVDAHPEPYRDPDRVAKGFPNEGANVEARGLMRDAPFSLEDSPAFTLSSFVERNLAQDTSFPGRAAVKGFSDANGYYPGAELASPGPQDAAPRWITAQWDGGVVLPSRAPYGMKAPGFEAGQELLFNCTADTGSGRLTCDRFGTSGRVAAEGGGGNPGDVDGHYGWNVEILEQSAGQATLRIWNSRYGAGSAP